MPDDLPRRRLTIADLRPMAPPGQTVAKTPPRPAKATQLAPRPAAGLVKAKPV